MSDGVVIINNQNARHKSIQRNLQAIREGAEPTHDNLARLPWRARPPLVSRADPVPYLCVVTRPASRRRRSWLRSIAAGLSLVASANELTNIGSF